LTRFLGGEVRKANKNQQHIFRLELLQGNSSIFTVFDFNKGDRKVEVKQDFLKL
jgi:hypothetical protein